MPASIGVLGTFQGDLDTVPYHAQRLPKSAEMGPILSLGSFPDREQSTLGQRAVQRGRSARDETDVGPRIACRIRGVHQPRATLRRYDPAAFKITKRPWLDAS